MGEQVREWLQALGEIGQRSIQMPLAVFVSLLAGLVIAAAVVGYLVGRSRRERDEEQPLQQRDYDSIRPLGGWTEEALEARLMDISALRGSDPESPQSTRRFRQEKEDRE